MRGYIVIVGRSGSEVSISRLEQEKKYLEETLSSLSSQLSTVRKEKFQSELELEKIVNGELKSLRYDCDSLATTVEKLSADLTHQKSLNLIL